MHLMAANTYGNSNSLEALLSNTARSSKRSHDLWLCRLKAEAGQRFKFESRRIVVGDENTACPQVPRGIIALESIIK